LAHPDVRVPMRSLPEDIWKQIYEYDPTFRREVWATVLDSLPRRSSAIGSAKDGFLYTAEKVLWAASSLMVETTAAHCSAGDCSVFFEASDRVSAPDIKYGLRKHIEWIHLVGGDDLGSFVRLHRFTYQRTEPFDFMISDPLCYPVYTSQV